MTGDAETIRAGNLANWLRTNGYERFAEEVDRLLSRLEAVTQERDIAKEQHANTLNRLLDTRARLEATEEALGWYAERRNYHNGKVCWEHETVWCGPIHRDGYDKGGPGARARAALAAAAPTRKCPNCNGTGKVRDSMHLYPVTCGRCDGTGGIAAAAPGETTLSQPNQWTTTNAPDKAIVQCDDHGTENGCGCVYECRNAPGETEQTP